MQAKDLKIKIKLSKKSVFLFKIRVFWLIIKHFCGISADIDKEADKMTKSLKYNTIFE